MAFRLRTPFLVQDGTAVVQQPIILEEKKDCLLQPLKLSTPMAPQIGLLLPLTKSQVFLPLNIMEGKIRCGLSLQKTILILRIRVLPEGTAQEIRAGDYSFNIESVTCSRSHFLFSLVYGVGKLS